MTAAATAWLLRTAAGLLDVPVAELDPARPLVEFGFSSRTAVAFAGLIAERFRVEVTPTLLWEHPTVRDLSAHLSIEIPAQARAVAPHPLTELLSESS